MEKVELVRYENGKRIVIGEAVVDMQEHYIDVSATVTDEEYKKKLSSTGAFSVFYDGRSHQPLEAVHIPETVVLKGKAPYPDGYQKAEEGKSSGKAGRLSRKREKNRSRRSSKGPRPPGA